MHFGSMRGRVLLSLARRVCNLANLSVKDKTRRVLCVVITLLGSRLPSLRRSRTRSCPLYNLPILLSSPPNNNESERNKHNRPTWILQTSSTPLPPATNARRLRLSQQTPTRPPLPDLSAHTCPKAPRSARVHIYLVHLKSTRIGMMISIRHRRSMMSLPSQLPSNATIRLLHRPTKTGSMHCGHGPNSRL
jgi:hypothetical protein